MTWLHKFFSGDNAEIDIKAILATMSFLVAVSVYAYYALWLKVDLPPNLTAITQVFVGAALLGGVATLGNQKLGVSPPPLPEPGPRLNISGWMDTPGKKEAVG